MTATPARIRRCIRAEEFAQVTNPAVKAARPDARPQGRDENFVVDSFFVSTAVAQKLLEERFAFQSSYRLDEAAETRVPLGIGTDIEVAPRLPYARMIDATRALDRPMLIAGIAVDHQSDRNSIEAIG
jgi:hypothetical protein